MLPRPPLSQGEGRWEASTCARKQFDIAASEARAFWEPAASDCIIYTRHI